MTPKQLRKLPKVARSAVEELQYSNFYFYFANRESGIRKQTNKLYILAFPRSSIERYEQSVTLIDQSNRCGSLKDWTGESAADHGANGDDLEGGRQQARDLIRKGTHGDCHERMIFYILLPRSTCVPDFHPPEVGASDKILSRNCNADSTNSEVMLLLQLLMYSYISSCLIYLECLISSQRQAC